MTDFDEGLALLREARQKLAPSMSTREAAAVDLIEKAERLVELTYNALIWEITEAEHG